MGKADMPKSLGWLAEYSLRAQLLHSCSPEPHSVAAETLLPVLLRIGMVRHWFGKPFASDGQLMASFEAAKATDSLPAAIQHDGLWSPGEIRKAADAMPSCKLLLYFLCEILGYCYSPASQATRGPGLSANPCKSYTQFEGLVPDSTASSIPQSSTVLLQSAIVAAKLLTLIPRTRSTLPEVKHIACDCLMELARCCLAALHCVDTALTPSQQTRQ